MKLFLAIGIIYGVLTVIASALQIIKTGLQASMRQNIFMLIGGLIVSACSIIKIAMANKVLTEILLTLLVIGLILIQTSAILNGLKLYGKIHLSHHVIRFLISLMLIFLFVIC